jgi:hypothetical protein
MSGLAAHGELRSPIVNRAAGSIESKIATMQLKVSLRSLHSRHFALK